MFFFLGFQTLLITKEFLLHQRVVLDTFQLQQSQTTLHVWNNSGQLVCDIRPAQSFLLFADTSWNRRLVFLLLVRIFIVLATISP